MKKSILGTTLSCKFLYIVNNQNIYHLIKMEKVSEFVLDVYGIHELRLEAVGTDVKNNLVRKFLLYINTYCLGKVSLSKSGTAI